MKLRDYIKANDKAADRLAEALGVTAASIYRYAAGDRFPRPAHLQKIVQATHGEVTLSDLMPSPAAVGPVEACTV